MRHVPVDSDLSSALSQAVRWVSCAPVLPFCWNCLRAEGQPEHSTGAVWPPNVAHATTEAGVILTLVDWTALRLHVPELPFTAILSRRVRQSGSCSSATVPLCYHCHHYIRVCTGLADGKVETLTLTGRKQRVGTQWRLVWPSVLAHRLLQAVDDIRNHTRDVRCSVQQLWAILPVNMLTGYYYHAGFAEVVIRDTHLDRLVALCEGDAKLRHMIDITGAREAFFAARNYWMGDDCGSVGGLARTMRSYAIPSVRMQWPV